MPNVNVSMDEELHEGVLRLAADRHLGATDLVRSIMRSMVPAPSQVQVKKAVVGVKELRPATARIYRLPIHDIWFAELEMPGKDFADMMGIMKAGKDEDLMLFDEQGYYAACQIRSVSFGESVKAVAVGLTPWKRKP